MMYCTACRAVLPDDAEFCVACTRIVPDSLRVSREPVSTELVEEVTEYQHGSEGRAVTLALLLGLVGLLGIGHFYLFRIAKGCVFLFAGWAVVVACVLVAGVLPDSSRTLIGLKGNEVVLGTGGLLIYLMLWATQVMDAHLCLREDNLAHEEAEPVSESTQLQAPARQDPDSGPQWQRSQAAPGRVGSPLQT